jgi:hypothetical protein
VPLFALASRIRQLPARSSDFGMHLDATPAKLADLAHPGLMKR